MDDFRITPNGLTFSCWISNEYVHWLRWCIAFRVSVHSEFTVHTYIVPFSNSMLSYYENHFTLSQNELCMKSSAVFAIIASMHTEKSVANSEDNALMYMRFVVSDRAFAAMWWFELVGAQCMSRTTSINHSLIIHGIYIVEKCLLFEACSHSSQQFFNVYSITSDLSVEFAVLWFLSNRIAFKLKC